MTKQEAFELVKKYYNDYYIGAKIKEESEENLFIKLELETKIVTLSYNKATNTIEEKERARRGTKQNNTIIGKQGTGMNSMLKATLEYIDKINNNEYTQATLDDYINNNDNVSLGDNIIYPRIAEGSIVRNIYNNKDYKVVKPTENNVIEVFDRDSGYLIFARADVKVMVEIPGAIERN